jgi:hypothetical protein
VVVDATNGKIKCRRQPPSLCWRSSLHAQRRTLIRYQMLTLVIGVALMAWVNTIESRQKKNVMTKDNGYMEITHDGFDDCKFISIKHTGEKLPASTKPRKEDWIPVVRITARCAKNKMSGTFKLQSTFKYQKGTLSLSEARVNGSSDY